MKERMGRRVEREGEKGRWGAGGGGREGEGGGEEGGEGAKGEEGSHQSLQGGQAHVPIIRFILSSGGNRECYQTQPLSYSY